MVLIYLLFCPWAAPLFVQGAAAVGSVRYFPCEWVAGAYSICKGCSI